MHIDKGSLSLDLAPEGNFELAQADMLANVIGDLETVLSAAFSEKDPDSKVCSIFWLCTVCCWVVGGFAKKKKQKSGTESNALSCPH